MSSVKSPAAADAGTAIEAGARVRTRARGKTDTRPTALARPGSALGRAAARRASPPWHPAFVHFPLACWVLATLLDVATLGGRSFPSTWDLPDPAAVSALLLWLGLATSVPTIGFGLVDYARLPPAVRDSTPMLHHVAWMAAAFTLFLAAALLRAAGDGIPAPYFNAIEVLGTVCLVAGGHSAAIVVFDRLPQAAADARSADRDLST